MYQVGRESRFLEQLREKECIDSNQLRSSNTVSLSYLVGMEFALLIVSIVPFFFVFPFSALLFVNMYVR